jgi:hypothetical protein
MRFRALAAFLCPLQTVLLAAQEPVDSIRRLAPQQPLIVLRDAAPSGLCSSNGLEIRFGM